MKEIQPNIGLSSRSEKIIEVSYMQKEEVSHITEIKNSHFEVKVHSGENIIRETTVISSLRASHKQMF